MTSSNRLHCRRSVLLDLLDVRRVAGGRSGEPTLDRFNTSIAAMPQPT